MKISSWSSRKLFPNYEELRKAILDRYYNYEEGLNAILMFNVPGNQVQVNKLSKQYIHPHFALDTEPEKSYQEEHNKVNFSIEFNQTK